MISLCILGVALLCVLVKILWDRREFYKLILKVPGPLGWPLIGIIHKLAKREDILEVLDGLQNKYGSLMYIWVGPCPVLITNEPQYAQDVLTSPHCVNKALFYDAINDAIGLGLLNLKDPEWSIHRKLINPAFSHGVLKSFTKIFDLESDRLVDSLMTFAGKSEVNVAEIFQEFVLNIATKTTMGQNIFDLDIEENKRLVKAYHCLIQETTRMCFCPWLRYKPLQRFWATNFEKSKNDVHNFIRKLIHEKLEKCDNNIMESTATGSDDGIRKTNAFIDTAIDLLKSGEFTLQNVEDEANIIVVGAFEVTANTFFNTLMMLAMFPEYQQRAFDEILTIFPDRDNVQITFDGIQELKYLDMAFNETMRVMAPVPIVARQANNDIELSNGVRIPRGTQIAIDILYMQRRKDIWGPEAHMFNPENFLPSNLEGKHPFAFMPFSKGLRSCIGSKYAHLLIKGALAKLLRNYRFTTQFHFDDLQFEENITMKLRKVPLLGIERRST